MPLVVYRAFTFIQTETTPPIYNFFNAHMRPNFSSVLTRGGFTSILPCHQRLGSCQGGILLPVSGMPGDKDDALLINMFVVGKKNIVYWVNTLT